MDILEGSGGWLASILLVITFIFLLSLARGFLSERQQGGAWLLFGILFFSVCILLFRNTGLGTAGPRNTESPVVGAEGAGVTQQNR